MQLVFDTLPGTLSSKSPVSSLQSQWPKGRHLLFSIKAVYIYVAEYMSMAHHVKGINLTHPLYFIMIVHSSSLYTRLHMYEHSHRTTWYASTGHVVVLSNGTATWQVLTFCVWVLPGKPKRCDNTGLYFFSLREINKTEGIETEETDLTCASTEGDQGQLILECF